MKTIKIVEPKNNNNSWNDAKTPNETASQTSAFTHPLLCIRPMMASFERRGRRRRGRLGTDTGSRSWSLSCSLSPRKQKANETGDCTTLRRRQTELALGFSARPSDLKVIHGFWRSTSSPDMAPGSWDFGNHPRCSVLITTGDDTSFRNPKFLSPKTERACDWICNFFCFLVVIFHFN